MPRSSSWESDDDSDDGRWSADAIVEPKRKRLRRGPSTIRDDDDEDSVVAEEGGGTGARRASRGEASDQGVVVRCPVFSGAYESWEAFSRPTQRVR